MSDVGMVKVCAIVMGYKVVYPDDQLLPVCVESSKGSGLYNPLVSAEQLLDLIKRHNLSIGKVGDHPGWRVTFREPAHDNYQMVLNDDLNRAVVECVFRIHALFPDEK